MLVYITSSNLKLAAHFTSKCYRYHVNHHLAALTRCKEYKSIAFNVTNQSSSSYYRNYWTSKQFNESDNYDFNTSYSAIKKALWNITSPSSGLYLYTVAASLCDDISLYGFYPFYTSSDGRQLKHHYYENTSMDYAKLHRMPEEFKLFTVLHKFGFIRLVLDRCSQNSRRL
ncbi:alpha-N-acetylneuraminide alpha-2,8-sialyltransferase-like [Anneissia japonica]|uniref:alpha-N-acetylneuraminide alpha-2,8-sialyltransferase-like n=1 Tax=Anneissia japonica TaxID=1529436 RepID=UPI0014258C7C|nr:alpha-N-acetylneuraminide alpha-2,8-sialyltransferase-like [Anneissia japonica]